jgi:hypothetical protein
MIKPKNGGVIQHLYPLYQENYEIANYTIFSCNMEFSSNKIT